VNVVVVANRGDGDDGWIGESGERLFRRRQPGHEACKQRRERNQIMADLLRHEQQQREPEDDSA